MRDVLIISLGAALGANLRYFIALWAAERNEFPLGTLFANLLGCFLIGLFMAWGQERFDFPPRIRLLVLTGFLGSLTTFSTFSFESYVMMANAETWHAYGFVVAHILLGLLAVGLGLWLVRFFA